MSLVVIHVAHKRQGNLMDVGKAPRLLGLLTGFAQCRQQHRRQNSNDGDDHQQFNQGKCAARPRSCHFNYFRFLILHASFRFWKGNFRRTGQPYSSLFSSASPLISVDDDLPSGSNRSFSVRSIRVTRASCTTICTTPYRSDSTCCRTNASHWISLFFCRCTFCCIRTSFAY